MTTHTCNVNALMDITPRPNAVFVKGEGSWLWDHTGKRYLDFVQGWAVNCLGHSPPVLVDAITAQAARLMTPSPAYYNDASLELAGMLTQLSGLDQVFFANSGAEANEGAIKLARKYGAKHRGGAHEIITFDGGFHGRTLATMSASYQYALANRTSWSIVQSIRALALRLIIGVPIEIHDKVAELHARERELQQEGGR